MEFVPKKGYTCGLGKNTFEIVLTDGRNAKYYISVYRLNQGNLEVSFEPGRSLRSWHLFDLCFWELQDMSNPRNPQASRMVPLMLISKKYAVVLYYNTQASVPTINLV